MFHGNRLPFHLKIMTELTKAMVWSYVNAHLNLCYFHKAVIAVAVTQRHRDLCFLFLIQQFA